MENRRIKQDNKLIYESYKYDKKGNNITINENIITIRKGYVKIKEYITDKTFISFDIYTFMGNVTINETHEIVNEDNILLFDKLSLIEIMINVSKKL